MADTKLIRFVGIMLMVIAAVVTVELESKFSDEKVGLAVGGPIGLAGVVLWAFGAALSSFLAARNATTVDQPLEEGATRLIENGRGTTFSSGIIAGVGFMGLALIIPLWPITLPIFAICAILSVGYGCFGYSATGSCPHCTERLAVAKRSGGMQCKGCGGSMAIRNRSLVPIDVTRLRSVNK